MHVSDHKDQEREIGCTKPPQNKMAIDEHQPAAIEVDTCNKNNVSTAISLPVTMPPPPPLLLPPKYSVISPSGSSMWYVGGHVPPAGRLPFFAQNAATRNTSTLPTLPLLPFLKFDNGQEAPISQHNKPSQVSSTKNVDIKYPELELSQRKHIEYDTNGSKGCVADGCIQLCTQRHATRADVQTSSSLTTNWLPKQSNDSSVLFGWGASTKLAHNAEETGASELIRHESCLPKAPHVDDARGLVGVGTSSNNKPQTQCKYPGVSESQNVSKRKGGYLEITPVEESTFNATSPTNVSAIIGKGAFLRLRGEMIKHQKQFVEQVFELHRLIVVQKLIARSRRTLAENKHKLEKPSSSRTKNPRDAQKGLSVDRHDDISRLQCSSGYVKDAFKVPPIMPRPNHETSAGNLKAPNTSTSGINSHWLYPPTGTSNHWLVPVISPSEGLIYKPYPIPSSPSPAGFIQPPVQTNPPKPAQTRQQIGIRPLSDIPFCFPPYMTPSLSSTSAFEHVGKVESYNHPRTALAGNSLKSSWNFSTLGSGTISCQVDTTNQTKHGGDSTASSSPPDKTPRNILPLFPEEPTAMAMLNKSERKVIKVVPHPPTSAKESTARIIRSIWEERN